MMRIIKWFIWYDTPIKCRTSISREYHFPILIFNYHICIYFRKHWYPNFCFSPFSVRLVISSPAWPICEIWCLKLFSDHFLRWIFETGLFRPELELFQYYSTSSLLDESQSLTPLLILVINLSCIKYDDVGNLRKFEYLYNYLGHLCTRDNTM